ncbi:hypothetical protein [Reichenbachiella ulvae]|uniref:HipA-like C-terminal domain-containing protein n=1 Tax=Reichenbachiella ulvae TaxID=2980104 RepID=A0ABT3CZM9_9BACT|nr:hypothetical protein [Reichenbachiella ulvae]MCV9389148.1 hypothetical protein [Reichenbachiella ulvae]
MEHPIFTDISNWEKIAYSNTGGTRSKKIYIHPTEEVQYFFKGSKKLKDGSFKYPNEFWSEIASSKIGQMLGFHVLDYNIGYDKNDEQKIGCLSKSMISNDKNKLAEGIDYLRGFSPNYNPKTDEYQYTFEFIINALDFYGLKSTSYKKIIEMVFLDAIIGNSDRHHENWAFITNFSESLEEYDRKIEKSKGLRDKLSWGFLKYLIGLLLKSDLNPALKGLLVPTTFSPIYDSGCSLGRENTDDRIDKMLSNPQMMDAYISRKGKSEIRIKEGNKPNHFELLNFIKINYISEFNDVKNMIVQNFNIDKLKNLIENIDYNLPREQSEFSLSNRRKELMYKIVTLRIQKIKEL